MVNILIINELRKKLIYKLINSGQKGQDARFSMHIQDLGSIYEKRY